MVSLEDFVFFCNDYEIRYDKDSKLRNIDELKDKDQSIAINYDHQNKVVELNPKYNEIDLLFAIYIDCRVENNKNPFLTFDEVKDYIDCYGGDLEKFEDLCRYLSKRGHL